MESKRSKLTAIQKTTDCVKDKYFNSDVNTEANVAFGNLKGNTMNTVIDNTSCNRFKLDGSGENGQKSVELPFTTDYYEYEQGQHAILVKGRLKNCIDFWKDIGANDFVISSISEGYKIPFISKPEPNRLQNNRSAVQHADFVTEAIEDLVKKGLALECNSVPTVVNPLSVSIQSSGKKRLILDLRAVNKHLWKQSVKYEDLRTALLYIKKGDWMFKFDIHSAYHHVDIFEAHTQYLGFAWKIDGKIKYFRFVVLPFGIRTAPFLFSKITRALVKKWRRKRVIMYLDDGFGCHDNEIMTQKIADEVKLDLINSGFVPKVEKSMWRSVQCLQWLGGNLNTENGIISIPEVRISKALTTSRELLKDVCKKGFVNCRNVARFVGQIMSMSLVVGNVTQLMTKCLSINVTEANSWDSLIRLSGKSVEQLTFWIENLKNVNGREMKFDPSCTRVVYSDASDIGYGGYCVEMGREFASGQWRHDEAEKSSTWRELVAVLRVLISIKNELKDKRIKWFTDNQNVVSIVQKGSMKKELQEIALQIFSLCSKSNIIIELEWIPRSKNEQADYMSRLIDYDDWGVGESVFKQIEDYWGPYEVDWFASSHNAKVSVFYSRYWCPGTSGIDAFTENWTGKNGWIVPPICLIARVIKHMEKCESYGTLVVPYWPSASFWPLICPSGTYFCGAVKSYIELPTDARGYTAGRYSGDLFGKQNLKFKMLALAMDFRSV